MKKFVVMVLAVGMFTVATGQDLVERICVEICSCMDRIENMDSLQAKLDRCIPASMEAVWNSQEDINQDLDLFIDEDTIQNTINSVIARLTQYCPGLREFILKEKELRYYNMSESETANEFYLAGNKAFESGDFKTAEKMYLKAMKEDPGWVYPYDNLGLTYRNTGKYKKAVTFYARSLAIYPEGSFALQNQAVAYTYLDENNNALINYNTLMNLYPDNPEGFFGTAKVQYANEEYEMALDFALYAHKMYTSQESEYLKDTEKLISLIHGKLKEQNKLDVFNEKARKFGVAIDLN